MWGPQHGATSLARAGGQQPTHQALQPWRRVNSGGRCPKVSRYHLASPLQVWWEAADSGCQERHRTSGKACRIWSVSARIDQRGKHSPRKLLDTFFFGTAIPHKPKWWLAICQWYSQSTKKLNYTSVGKDSCVVPNSPRLSHIYLTITWVQVRRLKWNLQYFKLNEQENATH